MKRGGMVNARSVVGRLAFGTISPYLHRQFPL